MSLNFEKEFLWNGFYNSDIISVVNSVHLIIIASNGVYLI